MAAEDVRGSMESGSTANRLHPLEQARGFKRTLLFALASREIGILIAAVVIFVVLAAISPVFLASSNLLNVARQIALSAIIATGMTFLLIGGEIDLSVGSLFGFCVILLATLVKDGNSPWVAGFLVLLVGGMIGAVNGVIATKFGIPSFVVTLGMLSILRGFSLVLTSGWPISSLSASSFFAWTGGALLGIPAQAVWMVVIMLVMGLALAKTKFGHHVYATGGNRQAANAAGIDTDMIKIGCFVLSGCLCAVSACLHVGFFRSGQPLAGQGMEMTAVAAAIIGGTKLSGGVGSVFGTFLGAVIMGMIGNGLVLLGVEVFWQEVAVGAVILAAVIFDALIRRRET